MAPHIAFRKRQPLPKFNYHKVVDALSISYRPAIVLPQLTKVSKVKKTDTIEEDFLNHAHQIYCQMLGYLPISDPSANNSASAGPFASKNEKTRQLKSASGSKKKELMKRWGMEDSEAKSYELKEEKMLLRHGELVYPFVKTRRVDNPRALELAVDVATGKVNIRDEKNDEGEGTRAANKLKFKMAMRKKQEEKREKDHRQKIEKRKAVNDGKKSTKKDRAAVIMEAAMKAVSEKQISTLAIKPKVEPKKEIIKKPINELPSGVFMNIQEEKETTQKKKKSPTEQEIKEQHKFKVENKIMFTKLHETGEDDLASDVKIKQGWDEASAKIGGEKIDSIAHLARNVKKVVHKNKKKYKKLDEVLNRQKQGKHKKLLRKHHNLRDKRVGKTATKMNKLGKRGHFVPGFMGNPC